MDPRSPNPTYEDPAQRSSTSSTMHFMAAKMQDSVTFGINSGFSRDASLPAESHAAVVCLKIVNFLLLELDKSKERLILALSGGLLRNFSLSNNQLSQDSLGILLALGILETQSQIVYSDISSRIKLVFTLQQIKEVLKTVEQSAEMLEKERQLGVESNSRNYQVVLWKKKAATIPPAAPADQSAPTARDLCRNRTVANSF